MKNPSRYSLLLFVLLGSCSGCQQRTNQEIQAQAPSCLIATQTTKELVSPSQQSQLELETVTVDGESFQVSTVKKSAYSYDQQGRILTEYNQYTDGKADSVLYQYKPMAVTIRTVNLAVTPKASSTAVVVLNSQGLAEYNSYLNQYATYDKDGYLLTLKADEYLSRYKTYTIVNGNETESISLGHDATPSHLIKSEYELSKPGLPSIQTFYGKEARNLLLRYTIQQNGPFGIYPDVYIGKYTYTFDNKGLITRQAYRGKNGEPAYIWGSNTFNVKDFTYICP